MTASSCADPARSASADEGFADRLMAEALLIIDTGRRRDVTLRLIGGLAVRSYAADLGFMRREFSDIDLIGRSVETARLYGLLAAFGYEENRHVTLATAGGQLQFVKPTRLLESRAHVLKRPRPLGEPNRSAPVVDHIDVFLDVMSMDHDVDVRDRLGIDPFAISPADVLLTKLQIGDIAEKDVHDVIALLKDVPLGDADDGACIAVPRVARVCAHDWGIWRDVTSNLELVALRPGDYSLSDAELVRVQGRIAVLASAIADERKSLRWRLRSQLGTRLPWRREVEEREGSPAVAPLHSQTTLVACESCEHAVEVSQQLADLPAAPLACPRCGSLDIGPWSPDFGEPAAA